MGGARIRIDWDVFPVRPSASVTVSRTVFVPNSPYVWLRTFPLPVVASPNCHAYELMVPSESEEPDASNATGWPSSGRAGEYVNDAEGRTWIRRMRTAVASRPSPPTTVRDTLNDPNRAYGCVAIRPVPRDPSPKSHAYDAIALSGSVAAVASKVTVSPPGGAGGAEEKAAA